MAGRAGEYEDPPLGRRLATLQGAWSGGRRRKQKGAPVLRIVFEIGSEIETVFFRSSLIRKQQEPVMHARPASHPLREMTNGQKHCSERLDGLVPNYVHWRRRRTFFYFKNYLLFFFIIFLGMNPLLGLLRLLSLLDGSGQPI